MNKKLFLILCFLAWPILIVAAASAIGTNELQIQLDFPAEWLPALRLILSVVAIFALGYPWLLERQLRGNPQARDSAFGLSINPEFWPLLIGLMFTASPASYGLVSYFLGAPIGDVYYFAAGSFLGIAAWGLHEITV